MVASVLCDLAHANPAQQHDSVGEFMHASSRNALCSTAVGMGSASCRKGSATAIMGSRGLGASIALVLGSCLASCTASMSITHAPAAEVSAMVTPGNASATMGIWELDVRRRAV